MTPPLLLTDPDIRKLLSVIDDPRDQAMIIVILSTGLFLSELIALDVTSIDFDSKTIQIDGKRKRTVVLKDSAITALNSYLEIRPKTPEAALIMPFVRLRKQRNSMSATTTYETPSSDGC